MEKDFMNWLLKRLQEVSTWRGIVLLLTAIGVKLEPDLAEAIIAAGLAIVGTINILRREGPPEIRPAIATRTGPPKAHRGHPGRK
jgi:hypothetical protein